MLLSSNTDPYNPQSFYYAQPPIPLAYTVQKLSTPLEDGKNLILRVHYVEDTAMKNYLDIYQNGSQVLTLKDDGIYPDATARDYKYAAFIQQDINTFITSIKSRQTIITEQGYVRHFTGHASKIVNANEITLFDETSFNNNLETGINPYLLDVSMCSDNLKKKTHYSSPIYR